MKTSELLMFLLSSLLLCVEYIQSKATSLACTSGEFASKNQCLLCHPTCTECDGHELFDCTTCGVDEDGHERFLHQGHCLTYCPRGLYPDRAHFVCLPCITNCELCTDSSICAKCREHYKLQNGVCQTAYCDVGQVQDPETGECLDCEMGCKTCSTEDPEICNSCLEGYFLFRHQCRHHCPQTTYEDQGRGVCLPCPAPCIDCRMNSVCLACQAGYYLNDGECVKQCPQHTFSDASGRRCQVCHSSCQTCHGPQGVDCDLCPSGNAPLHGQCPLVNCQKDQFFDESELECHSCDASCKTCFGPQALDCSSCFEGYYLDQDSVCVDHCSSGSYANPSSQLCEECSPNCETCEGTSDNCVSCPTGSYPLFLHLGRCWSNCPEGFFETDKGLCEVCDTSCLTCEGTKSQCLSCADNHFLESGQCRPNCSLRTYPQDDGTCRRCPAHCDICSDDRTCFKCSFLYLILNGVCKASCPIGYYEDMDEGRCGECHTTCASCSGPLADDCETCSALASKLYQGTCSKECPTGTYYESSDMECQECYQTCAKCSGSEANQCTQCEKGLVLDPNTLLCGVTGDTDCPPRTFLHDDQFTCKACHRYCQSCGGPGHNECQTCTVPKYLQNSTCVSECPAGTYSSRQQAEGFELGFCSSCDHVCATCSGASPKDCLTCTSGYFNLLHLCVSHCPTGYYSKASNCEKCDPSCELCSGPGPESCQICLPPLLELQGTRLCVEHCPHRFYPHLHVCRQCHTSCRTCKDSTPQGCLTCDWGSTLQYNVCYPHCEEGQYFSENETCEPCDMSCRHCTGPRPNQCLSCHTDSGLHAVENHCAPCCQSSEENGTDCCVCDLRSALCVETSKPWLGSGHTTDLHLPTITLQHTSAALPMSLLLALGLAMAVFVLVQAYARKRLCWSQSYERLRGSGSTSMPHGVPEPDSGDEADMVYSSKDGSVYRRYSFIHDQAQDQDVDESTYLNRS